MPGQVFAGLDVPSSWDLSATELRKFEREKVVVRTDEGKGYERGINAFLQINAPAEWILALISDYPNLPTFMPNLERVDVLESTASGAVVGYYLALPFGVEKKYRLKLNYDATLPELEMSWEKLAWPELADDETIVSTVGFWHLSQQVDTEVTLLHYMTRTNPGDVPFGLGWIVDYMTNSTVVELLERTKERAEKTWQERKEKEY
ncbi:MAG: SRPBCC family protein [Ghiorsea sp.]